MWPMDSMVMPTFMQALYSTSSPSADTCTDRIVRHVADGQHGDPSVHAGLIQDLLPVSRHLHMQRHLCPEENLCICRAAQDFALHSLSTRVHLTRCVASCDSQQVHDCCCGGQCLVMRISLGAEAFQASVKGAGAKRTAEVHSSRMA